MDNSPVSQTSPDNPTATRGETRRRQVLAAASECFSQSGFHRASMDQIAKKAGMSVGHIYHYFRNKEAIVAAIVEEDLQRRLQRIASIQTNSKDGNILAGMIDQVGDGLNEMLNPPYRVALLLECMAEASRNPAVAALVQASDEVSRVRWQEVVDEERASRGLGADPYREARTEVLGAIFDGLIMRSVLNASVDSQALVPFLQRVVKQVMEIE